MSDTVEFKKESYSIEASDMEEICTTLRKYCVTADGSTNDDIIDASYILEMIVREGDKK